MKTKKSGSPAGQTNKNTKNRASTKDNAGFISNSTPNSNGDIGKTDTVAPATWITPGLIEKTHTLWSKHYGRSLAPDEVREILRNVRRCGEIIHQWMNERITT